MMQNKKIITSSTGFHSQFPLNTLTKAETSTSLIKNEKSNDNYEVYKRTPHAYKSVICTPYVNKLNFGRK